MPSTVELHDIASPFLPAPIPCAMLVPASGEPLPLCILLLGAGGTRESLFDLQPVFDGWWDSAAVPRMVIAVATAGLDYYLEEPSGTIRWDSFFSESLIPYVRFVCNTSDVAVLAGISGGGYGALKLAFAQPYLFAAVAAMQPMLEPGLRESDVRPRNRLHHSAGGCPKLIGPGRDAALWVSNNPANRAQKHAEEIRDSGLALYLETGDKDFLNAHDGAEFLHRVLWDLDVSHEYRLVRGADHGGPSMRPRLRAMFEWFGSVLTPQVLDAAEEEAASVWLRSGMQGKPPAGATTTAAFIGFMRMRFEALRSETEASDPTTKRRFGVL